MKDGGLCGRILKRVSFDVNQPGAPGLANQFQVNAAGGPGFAVMFACPQIILLNCYPISYFLSLVKCKSRPSGMEKQRSENFEAGVITRQWSDAQLVLAAILGDLQSFDTLALRYRAAAYRVAQTIAGNELAEDVVQEALLLAFKALPSLEEPDKFASWLYAITRHAAYRVSQQSRQERAQCVELDEALLENSAALAQPFKPLETAETVWVRAGLEALAEDYRLLLQLRFYDEMPLKRIADFLDLPLTTVKWRLLRAKQLLRERLAPPRQPAKRAVKTKLKSN
jgi:RNA polymerase sigma-70 factor (ECF subfamily)